MTTKQDRPAGAAGVAAEATAGVVGAALGPLSGLVGRLRPQGRSLHPRGQVRRGTLVRHGVAPGVGVPWLDGSGEDEVLVRLSRSAGLPAPWPDVAGLAVRVPLTGGAHADLLMSSAWDRAVGRYLLRPTRRRAAHATTLFPLRSPSGPLLLGALPTDPDGRRLQLRVARPGGPWRVFGELRTSPHGAAEEDDPPPQDLRFDAVRHPLPGLPSYGWAARLRAPAYAAARRAGRRSGLR
jgi:hypothetical protein